MMSYPEDVLTKSKRGKIEVRSLIDEGKYVRYEYLDPKTGEKSENKIKLVLINENSIEEYFMIPLKEKNKFLLLKTESKGDRKIWDKNRNKAISLFTRKT